MKNILLIDQDSGFANLFKKILKGFGYTVSNAKNGKEAIKSLKQEQFDVVVTNLVVEYVTGPEIINFAKKNTSAPVIVISSITNKDSIADCMVAGCDAYMSKPLDIDEFVKQIRKLQHEHHAPLLSKAS